MTNDRSQFGRRRPGIVLVLVVVLVLDLFWFRQRDWAPRDLCGPRPIGPICPISPIRVSPTGADLPTI